jgi:hypothetical protein
MQNVFSRIAGVGVSLRRVTFVCLDVRCRVLMCRTWYLRRQPNIRAKVELARRRLRRALAEAMPDRLLVERPVGFPQQDQAMRLADALTEDARRCGFHVERSTLRAACVDIAGAGNIKSCAEVLAGQYEPIATLLAGTKAHWRSSDDHIRDRRSMLAAVAIANAAVVESLSHQE